MPLQATESGGRGDRKLEEAQVDDLADAEPRGAATREVVPRGEHPRHERERNEARRPGRDDRALVRVPTRRELRRLAVSEDADAYGRDTQPYKLRLNGFCAVTRQRPVGPVGPLGAGVAVHDDVVGAATGEPRGHER